VSNDDDLRSAAVASWCILGCVLILVAAAVRGYFV
jgi:hypothetical protein